MKNNIIVLFFLIINLVFLGSCSQNERNLFEKDYSAISMYLIGTERDSVGVNFLFYPDDKILDTVSFAVRLVGVSKDYDRYINLKILEEETTAEEGVHYESLKDKYLFRAGRYQDTLNIVVKRDISLQDSTYRLIVALEESDDFILGVLDDPKTSSAIRQYRHNIKIIINANLDVPPPFWNINFLYTGTGPYHPLKCKKFIEIAGVDDLNWQCKPSEARDIYIRKTRKWFRENPTYDEDKNRLLFE